MSVYARVRLRVCHTFLTSDSRVRVRWKWIFGIKAHLWWGALRYSSMTRLACDRMCRWDSRTFENTPESQFRHLAVTNGACVYKWWRVVAVVGAWYGFFLSKRSEWFFFCFFMTKFHFEGKKNKSACAPVRRLPIFFGSLFSCTTGASKLVRLHRPFLLLLWQSPSTPTSKEFYRVPTTRFLC